MVLQSFADEKDNHFFHLSMKENAPIPPLTPDDKHHRSSNLTEDWILLLGSQLYAYKSSLAKGKYKYVGLTVGICSSKRIQLKADSPENDGFKLPKRTKKFKYTDAQDSRIDRIITSLTKSNDVHRLMSCYICSKTFYTDKNGKKQLDESCRNIYSEINQQESSIDILTNDAFQLRIPKKITEI
jgi:hypothetical protein